VLPRHGNLMYVKINDGHHFGVSCIIGSFLDDEEFDLNNMIAKKDKMKRLFTI